MDRSKEDLVNMGLALVIGPNGGSNANEDVEEGVGSISNKWLILGEENSSTAKQNSKNESEEEE